MMPFWRLWSTVAIITITIIVFFRETRKFTLFKNKEKVYLILSFLLLLLYLSTFLRFGGQENLFDLQKRVGFIIIPFGILFIKEIKIQETKIMLWGFLAGIFMINTINEIRSLFYYLEFQHLPFANGSDLEKILLLERPYIGFLNSISFLISAYFISKKYWLKTNLFLSTSYFMSVFLISARASIIIMALIIVYLIFTRFNSILKALLYSSLIPIILILGVFLNPNLKERISSSFLYEPRSIIWPCVTECFKNNPEKIFFGTGGVQNTQLELDACYKIVGSTNPKWDWIYDTELHVHYNTHNQFLDILMSFGIIGIILFAFWLYVPLYKNKNHFLYLLIICFTLSFLLENFLARQIGVYMTFMMISLAIRSDFQRIIDHLPQEIIPEKDKEKT